jgi:hypothetical protein
MSHSTFLRPLTLIATAALAVAAALPLAAHAQDFAAMLRQSQMQSDQMSRQMNQMMTGMVQQKMQDPQVRAGYAQYVAQMRSRGLPAVDFPTYAEQHIATRGFTPEGMAFARGVQADIQARDQASLRGLREAQAARGQAQQDNRDSYFRNQQEAGRGLMGQSTYYGPNASQTALPHTWQPNTSHVYQGNTYRVNEAGQYYVRSSDGWWHPVNR